MTTLKISISNIMEIEPNPIHCMALNENIGRLALFRGGDTGAIEIWDVSHVPYLEKRITRLEMVDEKPSIESMIWINDRLISCGLHGFVLEHDLRSRKIKNKVAATSGPVWCIGLSPDKKFLAAGTEDGFINIFEVFDEELIYLKVMDRQDGRVLCLSWSPCGKYIATGSVDSLRVWDVEKGHAMQRIMTGRSRNNETIVWSILMLDDFQVVTGDSRGLVCIWDGRIGVLVHKIYSHKADVLNLVLSSDKSTIYAAGVDPTVVLLSKVGKYGDKWIKSHQRVMHTNDVMCLATYGNKLFSGGIDADLVLSAFEKEKIVTKYPPLPTRNRICVSAETRRVLIQNGRTIDIWQLPTENQNLVKLVELRSKKQDVIHSASMSSTGEFIAYSTESKMNFFRLSTLKTTNSVPTLKKLPLSSSWDYSNTEEDNDDDMQDEEIENNLLVSSLYFIDATRILGISLSNGPAVLIFMQINEETGMVHLKRKNRLKIFAETEVTCVATESNHVALANSQNTIYIYSINSDFSLTLSQVVPKYSCQPTVITFHPCKPYILVAYVDRAVTIFNYKVGKIVYNDKIYRKPAEKNNSILPNFSQSILNAVWSFNGEFVVLHDVETLYLMELTTENNIEHLEDTSKRKKFRRSETSEQLFFNVKSSGNKYKFIASVDFLNEDNELLAIEVKPTSLLEKLPPAFAKKRFGM